MEQHLQVESICEGLWLLEQLKSSMALAQRQAQLREVAPGGSWVVRVWSGGSSELWGAQITVPA